MRPLKLNIIGWLALLLVIVGALNWLLVGIFEYDLVATIFGDLSTASKAIYTLVGLSGIYLVFEAVATFVPMGVRTERHIGQH